MSNTFKKYWPEGAERMQCVERMQSSKLVENAKNWDIQKESLSLRNNLVLQCSYNKHPENADGLADIIDHGQTAPVGSVWSGSVC